MLNLRKILLSLALFIIHYSLFIGSVRAAEPFPPFSVEGNPDDKYQFEEIFPLFTYIKPGLFQVFENRDMSRNYQHLAFCPGGDHRDYECSIVDGKEVDTCDGGDVDLCHVTAGVPTSRAHTVHSGRGNCKVGRVVKENAAPGEEIVGKCEYSQTPKVFSEIKGTDFSRENRVPIGTPTDPIDPNNPVTPEEPDDFFSGLVFPKLQNEALRYGNFGGDNAITWGSHFLSLNQCERSVRQLLVVTRAKQTKNTLAETGEWPLGWVDWGYETQNGKTLLQIQNELPAGISGYGFVIAESVDDFFLNAGNLEIVTDVSEPKKLVCDQVAAGLANNELWATDLSQAPLYSPSFRQGFVRGSICIWDLCCPGPRCPLNRDEGELEGASRSLYYDISVSQAFGAALNDLMLTYSLESASKIFADIAGGNQLVRFATSASTQAVPSVIRARLDDEISDPCFEYRPNPFRWLIFGTTYDYLNDNAFLDPDKKCPGYTLQPKLTKEKGGAFPESLLSKIINLIWRGATGRANGNRVDEAEPVKYHLLTVPDAMGQSLSFIQRHVYNTWDTLAYLDKMKEHNESISNVVDDQADLLYGGKPQSIADDQRFIGLYPCGFSEYSTHETSIEAYALGARNGCFEETTTAGLCDPAAFEEIVGDSPWYQPLPEATRIVLDSEMFVDGKLNLELEKVYAEAAEETGVPCEVLAGIHFEEASAYFTDLGNPEKRWVGNGGPLEGTPLIDTAIEAGNSLLRHPINNTATLITAISNFNGGGNSNCQDLPGVTIPYGGCPRLYIGEDDPYATHLLDSRHTNMYQIYCDDFVVCNPLVPYDRERPGAFAVALAVYNEATSKNNSPTAESPTASTATTSAGTPLNKFGPQMCSPEELDTALGCLPVSESLASTILSFVVGLSGAISLVVMLMGVFQTMTGGDPEKVKRGRELLTGAVVGLLFIIFSVVLLRVIAGDILILPGF